MKIDLEFAVGSLDELDRLYDPPGERAVHKQIDLLDEHCRAFIAASPFLVLATCGSTGADCSPRGDSPGFVAVVDEKTLIIPDRRGNHRIDSLRNIVQNPAVGLLFLVPGVDESLRINGRARISRDPSLRQRFQVRGRTPTTVLVVTVEQASIQCSRALVRSGLWKPSGHIRREALPSLGTILAAHTRGRVNAARYDEELEVRLQESLY